MTPTKDTEAPPQAAADDTAATQASDTAANSGATPGPRWEFGARLARLLEESRRPDGQRWTLSGVAEACTDLGVPVTRQYLTFLINGTRDEPRLSLVEALAEVFGVPTAYFTNDYLGRVAADLLPLLAAVQDPDVRALLHRRDLHDVAAALADERAARFLQDNPLPGVLHSLSRAPQSIVEAVLADLADAARPGLGAAAAAAAAARGK